LAKELTPRQKAILDFVIDNIREGGYPPTIAEIGAHFGISSTNGVNDHLVALERKGYIERSSKARGIRITEKAAVGLYESEPVQRVPLLGRIAAGSPILAQENVEELVPVQDSVVGDRGFCLRVQGDSMIEDGILDGDVIIVDQSKQARKGDIVVALVEDEATVKRFFPNGPEIELRPANSAMAPLRYPANSVQIQGVVVGLQRTI